MAALDDIRAAIAAAIEGVDGVQGYDHVPPQINTPCGVVAADGITYDSDFQGSATYLVPVHVFVSLGDWESAQRTLDPLVSHDGDVVAAINALRGDVDCRVVAMGEYGLTNYANTDYFSATLTVEVFA